MIKEFSKINNGLNWDNIDRHFTNQMLPNSYEILGDDVATIELDNQVFMLCSNDSKVDGLMFSNIQDEIAYIFS